MNCTHCQLPLPEPPQHDESGLPACYAHAAPDREREAFEQGWNAAKAGRGLYYSGPFAPHFLAGVRAYHSRRF